MKKISFPTAHTVLLLIAAFVAALTWLIPAGKYDTLEYQAADDKGSVALFIHHAQDGDKTYPGTQKTLDSLKMKIDIEKFESGAIWKAVGYSTRRFLENYRDRHIKKKKKLVL